MASERLQVILQLVTGQYKAQAAQAATATQAIGTSARTTTAQTATMGTKLKGLAGSGGGLLAVAGGAFAAKQAFDGTVGAFASFDDAMTQSLAIMGNVSEMQRGEMSDAAREVAKVTTFSAEEAAESYFFLASAGLDAAASIEALPAVAQFAQAGMFDMALATDLATDAQSALGLASDDAQTNLTNLVRVTDVFTRANQLANTSIQQISEAMTSRAGAALRALNKDVEEGAAVLAALADQGVKGAEAGTQLGIVLRDLQTKALANRDAFREAGVAVFDANDNMRNIGDIIADLEGRLDGMSDAAKRAELSQLGFSDRSIAVLTTLLGTSDAIREYERELRSAGGATEEVASKQLESASKQWELFKSELGDVGLEIGEHLVPALLDLLPVLQAVADVLLIMPLEGLQILLAANDVERFTIQTGAAADTAEALGTQIVLLGERVSGAGAQQKFFTGEIKDWVREAGTSAGAISKVLSNMDFLVDVMGLTAEEAEVAAEVLRNELIVALEEEHRAAAGAAAETRTAAEAAEALTAAATDHVKFRDYAESLDEITASADLAAPSLKEVADQTLRVLSAQLESISPITRAVGALDRLTEAEEALAKTEPGTRAAAEATLDVGVAAAEANAAIADLGGGNLQAGIEALATAMGKPTEEVEELLETLGLLDGANFEAVMRVKFEASGSAVAREAIERGGGLGGTVTVPVDSGPNLTRHTGGPGEAGVPYTIRPDEEVFIPHSGGDFLLNTEVINALKSAQSSEGGSRTVVNVGNVYGWEDFVEKVNQAGVDIRRFGWS